MNSPAVPSEWNRAHLVPGLCSVALPGLSVHEVATVTADAALAGIEWDTGAHVVDEASAEGARHACEDAGLAVLSLASSYRLGSGEEFSVLTDLALRAGAPRILVRAGSLSGGSPVGAHWRKVVEDAKRVAGLAGEHGLSVAVGYRIGAAAAGASEGTVRLLETVDQENIGSYWQPGVGQSDQDALAALRTVLPFLLGVHCFSWWPGTQRLPLHGRGALWESVAAMLHEDSLQLDLMLESVQDDSPANVPRDADFLNQVALREN